MDSAASDPFFLDWGSSVNINEDLRRAIRADIDDIESSTHNLQNSIKSEEKSATQLTKDCTHAYGELLNLRRFARDDRDNSTMNMQIQMRLRESLANEVVSIVTPPSSPDLESDDVEQDCRKEGSPGSRKDTSAMNLGRYIAKCSTEVKNLKNSIKNELAAQEQFRENLTSLEYDSRSIENRVKKELEVKCTVNCEVDAKRKEHEAEKQRIRATKESIQIARKKSGDHAQKIADYSKTLLLNKKNHAEVDSKLASELVLHENSIASLEIELTSMEETKATISAQYDNLILQFAEREKIHKLRDAKKIEQEVLSKNIIILEGQKEDLTQQLSTLKEQHCSEEEKLQESRKRKNIVEQLRIRNDKEDKEILEPARIEHPKYLEQKEQLAKEMMELHERSISAQKSYDTKNESNEAILNDLELQLKKGIDNIKAQKEEIVKLESHQEELRVHSSKEIKEHESFKISFEEALKAQKMKFDEEMQILEQTKKVQIETLNAELCTSREAENFKLEVIKRGASIISKIEKMESHLRNAEVHLNEEGKEIEDDDYLKSLESW